MFLFWENSSIQEIELEGIITNPKQEISGMDWYNDNLFLLPENLGGYLFMVKKKEIQKQFSLKKGSINKNDKLLIGPFMGKWMEVQVRSIHDNFKNLKDTLVAGQSGCLNIRCVNNKDKLTRNMIRRGMVLLNDKVLVSNHKNKIQRKTKNNQYKTMEIN